MANGEGAVTEPTVRLVRSGGFAGLIMSAVVPVTDLPEAAQSTLADAPAVGRSRPLAGNDRFNFALTIPTGPRRTRTYRFVEGDPPVGLEAVVAALSGQLSPE